MIQLTEDLAMIADDHCYIVGKPQQRPGRELAIRNPRYYPTADKAVQGALEMTMRQSVADGSITALRQFVEWQDRQREALQKLITPLE